MAVHLLGYQDKEGVIGLEARELLHPDDMAAPLPSPDPARPGSKGVLRRERRYRKADGRAT